jgi:hypothetical protein
VRAASSRKRRNPYAQVALTYLHRLFRSRWAGIWTLLFIVVFGMMLCVAWFAKEPEAFVIFSLVSLTAISGLAGHMKEQFADSRAHLMPGFRRVHATVAVVAALIFIVFLPTALTWLMGFRSVGFAAIVVLLFSGSLWMTLRFTIWGCLPFFTLLLGFSISIIYKPTHQELAQFVSGQFEWLAFALLLIGAGSALLAGVRLVRLNEDMPEYHWNLAAQNWSGKNQATFQDWMTVYATQPKVQQAMRKRSPREERHMARLIGHVRRAGISPWSRVCRWQIVPFGGWGIVFFCLLTVLLAQLMAWFSPSRDVTVAMAFTMVLMPTVLSGIGGVGQMFHRGRTFVYELSLPVDRISYIRESFSAQAFSHLRIWISTSIALALWWLTAAWPSPQPLLLGYAWLTSACLQLPFFGVVIWVARYRSSLLPAAVGTMLGLASFSFAPLFALTDMTAWEVYLPVVTMAAVILAAFGLLLVHIAYGRWLIADMD